MAGGLVAAWPTLLYEPAEVAIDGVRRLAMVKFEDALAMNRITSLHAPVVLAYLGDPQPDAYVGPRHSAGPASAPLGPFVAIGDITTFPSDARAAIAALAALCTMVSGGPGAAGQLPTVGDPTQPVTTFAAPDIRVVTQVFDVLRRLVAGDDGPIGHLIDDLRATV